MNLKNKENEILEWASRIAQSTAVKFRDRNDLPVYFKDYRGYQIGKSYELIKGCSIVFSENGDRRKKALCRMNKGVILDIHHHPDYDETFRMIKGVVYDHESQIYITKDVSYTFKANVSHTVECMEDCIIELDFVLL